MTTEKTHNLIIFAAFVIISTLNYFSIISVNTGVIGVACALMFQVTNKINQHILFQLAALVVMVWLFYF
ncbi:hypothetical protein [Fundicoccus culcitae]|uniref:Uncharacterized protein n=1 Tax=Fundicoccus culcitae TaxID=2969821 RepID=A0ABY5P910_9LACT|nr:hypothetical protein [Fundicoccus culcitae]UUX34908.1 hypothetical protein NRE15_04485 [Fundicoccus culcitae]